MTAPHTPPRGSSLLTREDLAGGNASATFSHSPKLGPCAKTTVTCVIVALDGHRFVGTNYCENPQPVCPRLPGEGYQKCADICRQAGHAEKAALALAGPSAKGAAAYITGHTYACQNCQEALFAAGVRFINVGGEP